jgi:hypothetical protein
MPPEAYKLLSGLGEDGLENIITNFWTKTAKMVTTALHPLVLAVVAIMMNTKYLRRYDFSDGSYIVRYADDPVC